MKGPSDGVIRFAEGLIGFPTARRFRLLEQEHSPVRLLCSVDNPGLRLPVVDPFLADPNYRPVLAPRMKAGLACEPGHSLIMLAITVLQPNGPALANLRAPLVINVSNCTGTQVVVDEDEYSMRTPVTTDASKATQDASLQEDRRSHAGIEQTTR